MAMTRRTALAGVAALPLFHPLRARAQGRWEPRAPVPWMVQEVYGATWNGRILIAGGMAPGGGQTNALARAGLYDPAADAWTETAPLPSPRHHPAVAVAGDTPFVLGGFGVNAAGSWVALTETLTLEDGAWRSLAPMPRPQNETVALGVGGLIHLISGRAPRGEANAGYGDHADIDLHQVFDPSDGRWRSARPCPMARNSATGAVIGGKLYLAAGRRLGGGNTGQLERYDPARDQWEVLKPMPLGAGGCAGAALGGKLYVFGGEGGPRDNGFGGVIPNCWSYDPATDEWTAEAPMGLPRHGLTGAEAGGRIYAIGGGVRPSGGEVSAAVEAFAPALSLPS